MAWILFDPYMEKQEDGNAVSLEGDVRCMLIDVTRAPVPATDSTMTDIVNNEVSGTNYAAGGYVMTPTIVLAAGTVTFDSDDPNWLQHAAGFNDARYAVIYFYTGTPATERPIVYADLGGNKGNVDGDLTLELNAAGIWTKAD